MLKGKSIYKWSNSWLLFTIFLSLTIVDRIITLTNFGFIYTDIDQMVMWNGAFDYSKGIFHEPFFYGQPYNYMLESFIAAPLVLMHIPVYIALPVATSSISLLPFIVLALFFLKRNFHFWAYLSLAIPVLLPLSYNFLTTISRGFVQAHLFIPLLFIPLFNPQSKKSVTVLFLAAAICAIANQSSLLIVLPIALFVYTYHYKSPSFYLKSLIVIPFLIADYFAKYLYIIHPERVLLELGGLSPNSQTFLASFNNINLFEYLFPFYSGLGIIYPIIFILLAVVALAKCKKKEFLFIISIIIILLATLAIPKVQHLYANAGVFYTSSRLYLYMPILLVITLYLLFNKLVFKKAPIYFLLLVCGITIIFKNHDINKTVQLTIAHTAFPVAETKDLVSRANELKEITEKYNIELIVHSNSSGWKYIFDSYAFNPLTQNDRIKNEKTISVNLNGDRRTWQYPNAMRCKQILLNGIKIDTSTLKTINHKVLNKNQLVISNDTLKVSELFDKLNLKFGNTLPHPIVENKP